MGVFFYGAWGQRYAGRLELTGQIEGVISIGAVELPIDAQGSARYYLGWVMRRNTDTQSLAQGEDFWDAQNAIPGSNLRSQR